jgi:hypothetical protein
MGVHNYKYENEHIQFIPQQKFFEPPQFVDYTWIISAITRGVSESLAARLTPQGQSFTTAAHMVAPPAPQAGTEAAGVADDIRKLSQRMDDLESRMAKV